MRKIKNLKVALGATIFLMMPLSLIGCKNKKDISLEEVIEITKDNSRLDDVLLKDKELLNDIDKILTYIKISEEISDMDLSNAKEITIDDNELTLGNVKNYISYYKKEKQEDTKNKLYTIKRTVNSYLVKEGYTKALDFSNKVFISNVIDNNDKYSSFNEDLFKLCDFTSGSYPESMTCKLKYDSDVIANIKTLDVDLCNDIYNLRVAKNAKCEKGSEYEYNKERNNAIKNAINGAFDSIEDDIYIIENKELKQKSKNSEINIKGVYK